MNSFFACLLVCLFVCLFVSVVKIFSYDLIQSHIPQAVQSKKGNTYSAAMDNQNHRCLNKFVYTNPKLCHCCRIANFLQPGSEVITLFPCSTQLSTKIILLKNVKMPTIVGILTFISMINKTSERREARNLFICQYFNFMNTLNFVLS